MQRGQPDLTVALDENAVVVSELIIHYTLVLERFTESLRKPFIAKE